jgi:tetratricopeptide (TPR) repeat protein
VAGEDADLAWLDDAAGREAARELAVGSLLLAGRVARRRFAIDRAVELHEQALMLATSDAERLDAQEQLGRDHDAAFHGEAALAAYTAALELARADPAERSRVASLARRVGSLVAVRGGAFHLDPDLASVDSLIEEGLEAASDPRQRAGLLIPYAEMAVRWSVSEVDDPIPLDRRLEAAREAARLARQLGDPVLTVEVAHTLSDLHVLAGNHDAALREVEAILPTIEEIESPAQRAQALFESSVPLLQLAGDPARALELAERSRELARTMSAHDQMHASAVIMTAAMLLGDWDRVEAMLQEHVANFDAESRVRCLLVQTGLTRGALVVAWRDDIERARALIDRPRPFEALPGPIEGFKAQGLVAIGQAADGLRLARSVLTDGPHWRGVEAGEAALLALEALQDWPALGQMAADLTDLRSGYPQLEALARRASGRSLVADGRRDEGIAALRSALEAFERLPHRFEAARTREALADLLPDERSELLAAAGSEYERLGAVARAGLAADRRSPS